jgi:hypothetical protein
MNALVDAKGVNGAVYVSIPYPASMDRKIKEIIIHANPPGLREQYKNSHHHFDDAGNLVERKHYKAGAVIYWQKFHYAAGELVEVEDVLYERRTNERKSRVLPPDDVVAEFNEKGQKVVSTFSNSGILKNRKVYNERDKIIESRNLKSDGSSLDFSIYTYNEKFQLFRVEHTTRNGNKNEDHFLNYDTEGKLVEEVDFPDDINNPFTIKDNHPARSAD